MADLRDLYQEVIMDHNRSPKNFKRIDPASHSAEGNNPLCGDQLELFLKIEDQVITDIGFQGAGCAIFKASASLMTDQIKGMSVAEATALKEKFHDMITRPIGSEANIEGLGKLEVLQGVSEYPVRVKCATLAWHTLLAAIQDLKDQVTTE